MPYATVNGIRAHYETHGAGDPVLLISGLGGPGVGWLFQVRDLSPRYQVITFDNRGVGETDMPRELRYATGELAEDARALLDHLNVKRAHVIGASMGGTVAMELAIRYPASVRSLTLCCTWAEGDGRFLRTIESWRALAPQLSLEDRFRHLLFPWLYSPTFLGDSARVADASQACARLSVSHQGRRDRAARPGLVEWNGTRLRELGKLRAPALVLVGRDDVLTPPSSHGGWPPSSPMPSSRSFPAGTPFSSRRCRASTARSSPFSPG